MIRTRQPQGAALLNAAFPRPSHLWMPGGNNLRDLVGSWNLSPAGGAKIQAATVGLTFETAGGSDTFNISGAPVTGTEKYCWFGLCRSDVATESYLGPTGNGYTDGGYVLRRDGTTYYTSHGSGFASWTSSLYTTGTWAPFAVQSVSGSAYERLWINGVNVGNQSVSLSGAPAYRRLAGSSTVQHDGAIALSVLWPFAIDNDNVFLELSREPWSLFAPSRRVVVFGAAAAGPTAYPLTASPATATLTGTDATFVYTPASTAYPLTASAGTATFSGSAATFSWGRAVNAAAGTAALAGTAATFSKGYQVTASAGTLTATGTAATFEFTGLVQYALIAEPSVVTVTGTSATFAYTGALVYTLTASPGSMTLTGRAATAGIPSASIWTDVGVSATTWSDVGGATSIWTDI
jgi:hypothetical protein